MSQQSFFSAESVPPAVTDLTGVLAAAGQVVMVGGGARLWSSSRNCGGPGALGDMITEAGLEAEITRTEEDTPLVRTAVDVRLVGIATDWTRGRCAAAGSGSAFPRRTERCLQLLGSPQNKPKLLIGQHTVARCFLAWRLNLGAGRSFHEVALDRPVEHAAQRGQHAVGVDGVFVRYVVEKLDHVTALDAFKATPSPLLQDIAAGFRPPQLSGFVGIILKAKNPCRFLTGTRAAVLLCVALDEQFGQFIDGLRKIARSAGCLFVCGVVTFGDCLHRPTCELPCFYEAKLRVRAQCVLPWPTSHSIPQRPALSAARLHDNIQARAAIWDLVCACFGFTLSTLRTVNPFAIWCSFRGNTGVTKTPHFDMV